MFCSVEQTSVQRGQERTVEDIRRAGPFSEFEILGDLIDGPLKARRIDAADAVTLHFICQDVF